jgi:hypothetical protein
MLGQGSVHGGQQPIVGTHVYLFASNTTGYGNASVSLLNAASTGSSDSIGAYVQTDPKGAFSITGDYTCTAGTQVYLYALGGDPGGGVNTSAGLLAALGNCPSSGNFLAATPFIAMNEVSTIATAYAIAGYATDATHVSSSGTALAQVGIANAFANVTNLETLASGVALATTPAGNGTVPQQEINTLANILAGCINSNGAITGPTNPTACYTLFNSALSEGVSGTVPSDTATAAINIAHNPSINVAALYGIPGAAVSFAPALTGQPQDFTIAVTFVGSRTGNGSTASFGPSGTTIYTAVDADGSLWSLDDTSAPAVVSKLSNLGVDLTSSTTFLSNSNDMPTQLAIDTSGNAWVANTGSTQSIGEFGSSGVLLSGSTGYTGGLTRSSEIESRINFDPNGNLLVPVSESFLLLSSSGQPVSPQPTYPMQQEFEGGVAIDPSGKIWYPGANDLVAILSTGVAAPNSPYTGGGISQNNFGTVVAIDHAGNVWVPGINGTIGVFTSAGVPVFPSGITDAIDNPTSISIDGSGAAYVLDFFGDTITKFAISGNTLVSTSNYGKGFLNQVSSNLSLDSSGNVWVADFVDNFPIYTNPRIVEFIGLAAPVVTPLAAGVKNNMLGTRP